RFPHWDLPSAGFRHCADCCSAQRPFRCMPLAVAPCQIDEISKACALDGLLRKGNVRNGRGAASGELAKSILDELGANAEHFQKGADLLQFVERALASRGSLFTLFIGYESDSKSSACAADRAVNADCAFVCHGVSFSS